MFRGSKFFVKWGLEDEDERSIAKLLMKVCLSMSKGFHTPVEFWLGLTLPELYAWTAAAKETASDD